MRKIAYYAVKEGRTRGIYGNWSDTQAEVSVYSGAVHNGKEIGRGYGKGDNKKYLSNCQVAGEVIAVLQALDYAIGKKFISVEILYDFDGIKHWATGTWGAKKLISQAYKFFYDQKASKIKVTFVKVQAHSGDYFNTLADSLVKKGVNL